MTANGSSELFVTTNVTITDSMKWNGIFYNLISSNIIRAAIFGLRVKLYPYLKRLNKISS